MRATRLAVVGLLAGCGRLDFDVPPGGAAHDAAGGDAGAPMPAFGAPVLITELLDTLSTVNPTVAADELEMFFVRRDTQGGGGDIYVTTRSSTAATWSAPVLVTELNADPADQSGLHLSRDGRTLWFASNRGNASHDIYTASRSGRGQPFSPPVLVAALSSASEESSPAVDGAQLYYVENFGAKPRDLWASRRSSAATPWATPIPIDELVDPADDAAPELSPDGLTLYFMSDRAGSLGGEDLWTTSRASMLDPFGPPVHLVELASTKDESTPWISADGRVIYFASDRTGTIAIYRASR